MTDTSNERYSRWYAKKGADRNERRRDQYAANPSLREANAQRARDWRAARAEGASLIRETFRTVNGRHQQVYSLGQIAEEAGYSASTVRLLVTSGVLPEPALEGVHRYYTSAEKRKILSILAKRKA